MLCRCLASRSAIIFPLLALILSGCDKKRSEAVVLAKEHIDVAELRPSPSSKASTGETKEQASDSTLAQAPESREMAPDEIDVDGYVMKKEVRGTSKDPRARSEEEWRVAMDIVNARQSHTIHTDRAHYDKVKVGDRIKVRYRQGQFTSNVWIAGIED
jgi:hypothetical protein